MNHPIIFSLGQDVTSLNQDLQQRYGHKYQLMQAASGEEAQAQVAVCREAQERIAMFVVYQELPGLSGTQFLAEIARFYPEARKVLLASAENTEAAIMGINQIGIDHYLITPWQPESALPVFDTLLEDWQASVQLPYMRVKGVMDTRAARIRQDSNLHHAAQIVALSGVSDLMVVDQAGNFVGVLSEGDILRAALPDFDEIIEEGGTLYNAYQIFLRKGHELSEKAIAPLIIREPITVHPEDHVAGVAVILITRQIRRLPVVKDGRLLGTIDRANICQAVVGML